MKVIDVDNYDPINLSGLIKEHDAWFVVVRGYLDGEIPPEYIAKWQIESVRQNNAIALMYHWAYAEFDPDETVRQADEAMSEFLIPGPLVIDLEDYKDTRPNREWFDKCIKAIRRRQRRPCIYSRTNWLEEYIGDLSEWPDVVYWLADYRGYKFEELPLPKGVTRDQVVAYQYAEKHPIDLNWFRDDFILL